MIADKSSNRFIWQDCLTTDIDKALDFFEPLVHWDVFDQTSLNVGRYPIVNGKQGPIAGILEMPQFLQDTGVPPYWTGYVQANLEQTAETIPTLGGYIFTAPARSPMGTSFVFADSGGAVLSAYAPSKSFSVPSTSQCGEFVWQRLYAADHTKSANFYSTLFDWRIVQDGAENLLLNSESAELVGDLKGKPSWLTSDTWVFFLGVRDLSKTTSALQSGGGSVIEETQIQHRPAVVSKDSQGAVVGFVEW